MKTLEGGCFVCGKEKTKPLHLKEGASFVQCLECGLIYQDPPPAREANREFYEKHYYENFGDRSASIQQSRLSLYRSFLSNSLRYHKKGRLLDIGSGYGDFLKLAENEGWEGWGVEPSRDASEFSKRIFGNRVLNQTLDSVDFPQNHFDVITLWNVIDCLPDPRQALRKIYRWLSPGGLLFIRTPNAFFHVGIHRFYRSLHPFLEKMGWEKEASVFLCSNFNAACLNRFLSEAGFADIQIENGAPTEGDAYRLGTVVRLSKSLLYFVARATSLLTGNRFFIGSNLVVKAVKDSSSSSSRALRVKTRILMKSLLLHGLALLGYLLGFPVWRRLFGKDQEIRILRYHGINEFYGSDLNVKESEFEKQLRFLSEKYSVISLEYAVQSIQHNAQKAVVITFDDGYRDNYDVAFPLLKAQKMPATVFLLTGEKGPAPQDRLLEWEQVREMANFDITFGSHGQRHVRLGQIAAEEIRREMTASKKKIESETRQPVRFFSYPYGTTLDFDHQTERLAEEAGYEAAFSAIFGTNSRCSNPFALRRIGIEAADTQFTFQAKLNGALYLLTLFDSPLLRKTIRWVDSFFFKTTLASVKEKQSFLVLSVDFPPHKDGISTISRELSARIAAREEKIFAIGPRDKNDHEFDRRQRYRIFRVPGYEWGYLRFLPLLLWTPWIVFRHRIRKVFAMSVSYGGILSWALSYFCPLEYLIFAHGYEFEKVKRFPLAHRLYLKIFSRAKKVIANSRAVRERLILFGVSPDKIEILHPGVDSNAFRLCKVPEDFLVRKGLKGRRILLTVGRLIERKGHDQTLEALPAIIQCFPDALYCIVGVGPQEGVIREKIRSLKLENHVRLLGKVSDEELVFLYNACEVFVMPSREIAEGGHIEGFGIVYLEANACGKPVIGGRSGGVGEAIRDGETGFLVDPARAEEITEKVNALLSDPRRAEAMGERGLKRVREEFNWEQYVNQVYRWFEGEPLQ